MKYTGVVQRNPGEYNHVARKMLAMLAARMRTTGQKFGRWTRRLQDGTRIEVCIILNGINPIYRVWVELGGVLLATQEKPFTMFLESGAYRVQRSDGIYTARYLLGPEIAREYQPIVEWDGIIPLTTNDIVCPLQTIGLPVPEDAPPIPFIGSLDPRRYTTENSLRGSSQGAYEAASRLPASMYSGKMRLYVQSLYGSDRGDVYSEYLGNIGEWPKLYVPMPESTDYFDRSNLGYHGVNNSAIITSPDFRYYYVFHNGTQLPAGETNATFGVRELVPYLPDTDPDYAALVSRVETLRNTLQDKYSGDHLEPVTEQKKQCSITEAALLSLLSPSETTRYFTIETPDDEGIPFGSPLLYGWKFTWSGHQWKTTCVYNNASDYGHAGRDLTIDFTLEADETYGWNVSGTMTSGGVVTASVTGDDADGYSEWRIYIYRGSGYPYDEFFYDYTFSPCSFVGPPDGIIVDAPFFFENFPVYGYYTPSDEWVSATFTVENRGYLYEAPAASDWETPFFCSGAGSITQTLRDTPDRPEMATIIKVGSASYPMVQRAKQPESSSVTTLAGGVTGWLDQTFSQPFKTQAYCPQTPYGSVVSDAGEPWRTGLGIYTVLCTRGQMGVYDWEHASISPPTLSGNSSLVIPAGNCNLVFAGREMANSSGTRSESVQETYAPGLDETSSSLGRVPVKVYEVSEWSPSGANCRPDWYHWSGTYTNPKGSSQPDGRWLGTTVNSDSWWCDYNDHIKMWVHYDDVDGELVYNQANGGSGDTGQLSQHAAAMAETEYVLNGNHQSADPNPDYDLEIVSFFRPTFGACIGSRFIGNLTTTVITSAVEQALTVSGTSILAELMMPKASEGYDTEIIDSFVGWA